MSDQAAKNLAALVQQTGASALVRNLETEVFTQCVGAWTVPMSVNAGLRRTCYINCPSRAFLDYGAEELDRLTENRLVRLAGRGALAGFSPLVAATGMDRQVQLNNWLVATNILPPANPQDWLNAFEDISTRHAGFIPVLRSVNSAAHAASLDAFRREGLVLLPIRKIFIRDYAVDQKWTTDETKDAKLLATSGFTRRPGTSFSAAEFCRAADLYAQLYLEKYSRLNPHYTAEFLQHAQAKLDLNLDGLFDANGTMVGVIGRSEQHGTLTGPIVGYDTALPQRWGLYRQLRAINHGYARTGQRLYNMSAGAERFKELRGGRAHVEYMVADFRCATRVQRRAAKVLAALFNRAARTLQSPKDERCESLKTGIERQNEAHSGQENPVSRPTNSC